jgi:hypothetical protein
MISSWSFHPGRALVGFTSCCIALILVSLSLVGVGENVSPNVQYLVFALFCLALGFAAFCLSASIFAIAGKPLEFLQALFLKQQLSQFIGCAASCLAR